MNKPTTPQERKYNTDENLARLASRRIVIPLTYEEYERAMATSQKARTCIEEQMATYPELFPAAMEEGYKLNGWTEESKKMTSQRFRRIRLLNEDETGRKLAYTIVSCDVLPYMTGWVSDVEKALFLKQFGVPDWGLTYVFGRNDSYWYRQSEAFGRYDVVGTTVAQDCVLGVAVSETADANGLTAAYDVFKSEAEALKPEYQPTAEQFCLAFDYPTAYRTSNMLDRHMEPLARWLAAGRYFHGHRQTAELRTRAWALFHN